ncbi:hypothetical protein GCM10007079_06860 [Nocardiopsis terrae]|uniref:Uncharacterized protein n=1 Tax=Nocardiopsis terrae TaxID=372655 RepID=A0ABR9HP21_9ACTN|nr:hypothetical protein [Nocardiopsis terrae]MBE1460733.1 hypothetical protein [Nocardiopsis terrae]GHC73165.1 hypothetical protein GCM10007079_06860 [Nocardiopsis terrae]
MSVPGVLEPTGPNRSLPRTGWLDLVPSEAMDTPVETTHPEPEQRPDPADANTPAEFLLTMRRYLAWAGDWSYLELEYKCGGVVSATKFQRALEGTELPGYVFLMAFVTACVGTDEGERLRWATSWHRLRRAARAEEDARLRRAEEEARLRAQRQDG